MGLPDLIAGLPKILGALAPNAIPVYGVLYLDWSAPQLLVVFWAESMVIGLTNTARIVHHRKLTGVLGHRIAQLGIQQTALETDPERTGSYLGRYATVLFFLTFAHGLFLGGSLLLAEWSDLGGKEVSWIPDLGELRIALLGMIGVALGQLVFDLIHLAEKPFSWLKYRVEVSMGRLLVLHMSLILGVLAIDVYRSPTALLILILAFKTSVDLLSLTGSPVMPPKPSRAFLAFTRWTGEDGRAAYQTMREAEAERQARWEQKDPKIKEDSA